MKAIPIRKINTPLKEPPFAGNFIIRELGHLLDGKDMVQELHRHDFYFILALEKGAGEHSIDFRSLDVTNNTVFFMRPGQVHQLRLKAASTGYLIQFNADFNFPQNKETSKLLRRAGHENICGLDANGFKKLLPHLTYIFQEFTNRQDGYLEIIRASLGIFLIELFRQRKESQNQGNKASLYQMERLEEFLELLEEHATTRKQAAEYAGLMHLSPNQLNTITRLTLGKTSSEIIREHILLEARRLLLATANQVKEIAYQLGYEDVSYFIRFFKKHMGYSPDAFRNNFR